MSDDTRLLLARGAAAAYRDALETLHLNAIAVCNEYGEGRGFNCARLSSACDEAATSLSNVTDDSVASEWLDAYQNCLNWRATAARVLAEMCRHLKQHGALDTETAEAIRRSLEEAQRLVGVNGERAPT